MVATPFIVPIQPVDSQVLDTTLGDRVCRIKIFTKHIQVPIHPPGTIITDPPVFEAIDPIFLDLYVDNDPVPLLAGVLCLNNVGIVRNVYLGFIGDLAFTDIQGSEDPQVSGLGLRWLLCYWPDLP